MSRKYRVRALRQGDGRVWLSWLSRDFRNSALSPLPVFIFIPSHITNISQTKKFPWAQIKGFLMFSCIYSCWRPLKAPRVFRIKTRGFPGSGTPSPWLSNILSCLCFLCSCALIVLKCINFWNVLGALTPLFSKFVLLSFFLFWLEPPSPHPTWTTNPKCF